MGTFISFTGRFHPLLVHLPIGILLMGLLLQWLSRYKKFEGVRTAVPVTLLVGMFSALLSCITGYLLSLSGEYDKGTLNIHMWMGIGVAAVSALLYVFTIRGRHVYMNITGVLLFLAISVTGHFGGSLTHGADYLTASLAGEEELTGAKPIADVQQAAVYTDVIQPVLKAKCYSCHGATKQKGNLRMDVNDLLMKGGKNGPVIVTGQPAESELVRRLLLPAEEKKHMPPKEKPQLTEQEVALLHWWIANGASFNKKVNEIPQDEKVKPILTALQSTGAAKEDVPAQPVAPAAVKDMDALRKAGATVIPVSQQSNYLEVNFISSPKTADSVMKLLLPLKQQLLSLKLSYTAISDTALTDIIQCKLLVRLHLDNTGISDKGLARLAGLPALQYLNLVGTNITANGLLALKGNPGLKAVYLFRTGVDRAAWAGLQKAFPHTKLDSGGYVVPVLTSDTTVFTKQPVK